MKRRMTMTMKGRMTNDNTTFISKVSNFDIQRDKKPTNSNNKNSNDEKQEKKKIVVTGDSILNGVNEKGLSKSHNVKVKNYPGATSEDILDKIDDLLKVKPDCLLVHVGTNDLTNNVNLLNSVKKMVNKVKNSSPNTKLVFSSVILRKDKKDISKKVGETNQRLKNYCKQKNIDFVDNSNIIEEHLGSKKLHLNKRGNSILEKNIFKYLRDFC